MNELTIKGMAKINLALDVLGKRSDGYHEVSMIMQTVGLYDELRIVRKENSGIEVFCDKAELPCNEHNLIYKAPALIFRGTGMRGGVSIHLRKNIPIAAGLAGGSTDAAAALTGINRLFELGLDYDRLEKMAVQIGADVPYCLHGGTCLSEGIGERLKPLTKVPDACVVIAKPNINVSTKYVYQNLNLDENVKHPDVAGMIEAIEQNSIAGVAARLGNVLETVTVTRYPQIEQMKQCLLEAGALGALMSGSGPTVFGLFEKEDTAKAAYAQLEQTGFVKQGCVTRFVHETCIAE